MDKLEHIFKVTYSFGLEENNLHWDYIQALHRASILVWDAVTGRVPPTPQPTTTSVVKSNCLNYKIFFLRPQNLKLCL